jgi:aspartate aminotransferase
LASDGPTPSQQLLAKHADKVSNPNPYKDNRDILIKTLTDLNFTCVNPKGAFYLFIKSPIADAVEFSEHAKKYGLLLVPSDSFGVKGYLRLATCVDKKTAVNSKDAFVLLAKEFNLI